jgi:hypothetical protein
MPSDIHKYYGLLTRFKGDMNLDTFFDGIDSFEDKGGRKGSSNLNVSALNVNAVGEGLKAWEEGERMP